jgi:protein O-mannosyl-transferase
MFCSLLSPLRYSIFSAKNSKNYNQAIIIAATLLFAFHPIHTEVVANIKSRDEILGLLFGLLSFYFIMLYHEKNKPKYYFFSLVAFFAALFCKENCLTFIAIIPLLLYFFTGLEIKKIVLKTIPYIGAVGIYLFIRSRVLQNMTFTNQISVLQNSLMAASNNAEMTATSFVLLGKYIYMTIIPYPLSVDYSYNQIPIVSWWDIKPILSLLVCAGMIGLMLLGFRKKSVFSFLIALFFITLFLSSNLVVKIAWTFGERFLYVPSLSFCIALPILTAKALKFNPTQIVWIKKMNFYMPILCLLIVYTIIVIPRNAEWKSNFTLCSSGVITSPNSVRTHHGLALSYMDTAKDSKDSAKRVQYYYLAIHEYKKAIELYPSYTDCYYDLGICYYGKGYQDSAIPAFKKALELDPKYSKAANDLGLIYINKAQYDAALSYLLMSYKADSNNFDALKNLGAFYENEKNYNLAFHYDSLLLKIVPNDKPTLSHLSMLHNDIGMQYAGNNALDKSLEEFFIALKCDSNSANVISNIGVIYAKKGNIEMAKAYLQKALAKDPKNEAFVKDLQMLNGGH